MSGLEKYEGSDLLGLKSFYAELSEAEQKMVVELLDADQGHLFANWESAGINDDKKKQFVAGLAKVNGSYPGGLTGYISNAQTLLAQAKEGKNPFEGFTPAQPNMADLTEFNADYAKYEAIAKDNYDKIGFVLVAGGLGERLGYSGIKLDIPVEVVETTSYLAHYAASIKAMESRMVKPQPVPFVIMTSEDTNAKTLLSLEENKYFGLQKEQVHILMQELVPAISDNDGHLALKDTYSMIMKPHGHGDIHMLLHTSGVAAKLNQQGINHLVFVQDTNGQVFNAALPAVGVSIENDFDFNSMAVNRIPGEAVGGLAKLVSADKELTLNVEYNQLDPLLRATVSPEGDVPNEKGFSIFPGNINVLVIKLASYAQILADTQGIIAEFVNPKYADDTKTTFKKPTRLETMMQDLPKLFDASQKVGVTIFNRQWCFSADKNNIIDAAAKHAAGGPPESAATSESDFYLAGRMKLAAAGMTVSESTEELILDIPFTRGPKALLRPSFALTISEARAKISGGSISDEATLIVEGKDVILKDLILAGSSALVIKACEGAHVTVDGLTVDNPGFELVKLTDEEQNAADTPEYLKIRGYKYGDKGASVFEFNTPGEYTINAAGEVV